MSYDASGGHVHVRSPFLTDRLAEVPEGIDSETWTAAIPSVKVFVCAACRVGDHHRCDEIDSIGMDDFITLWCECWKDNSDAHLELEERQYLPAEEIFANLLAEIIEEVYTPPVRPTLEQLEAKAVAIAEMTTDPDQAALAVNEFRILLEEHGYISEDINEEP